eukprot:GEMP01018594.1.p1 GENE.GEMP01018594.1~~GEMP01018594.1.p1  ORF type:complete len:162 (+),score=43.99 GEMP01018594.1:316-801(+)
MQQAGGGHVQLPRNIHEIQQLYASMGGAVPQNIPESSAYATFQNDLNATCAAAEGDDNRWMAHWVSLQVMPQAVLCRVLDATDSDAYDISKTRLWRKVLRAIGHAVESATVAGLEQFNVFLSYPGGRSISRSVSYRSQLTEREARSRAISLARCENAARNA